MNQKRTSRWRCALVHVMGVATLFSTGCTGFLGSRFSPFADANKLTDSAKAIRTAYADPQPLPRELDKHVAALYRVEPGDVLLVQPSELDSPVRFPGDQPILPDGTINLGRFGELIVAGMTVAEVQGAVRAQIQAVLQKDQSSKEMKEVGPISVRVVTRQSQVFYVLGEVNAPGSFALKGNETVLDAIISAGGLNDRASRKNIVLSRPTAPGSCRTVLPICYNDIVQLGDTATNYQLAAGDRIFVAAREFGDQFHRRTPDCGPCGKGQTACVAQPPAACAPTDGAVSPH